MTDEKDIGRRSSQDRHLHRLSSIPSHSKMNSFKHLSDNPYDSSSFQHHPMDFVSVLSLSHRRPSERDKTMSRSFASDLQPTSYSFRSPNSSLTPLIALPTSSADESTSKRQLILPTLTPRGSKSPRKFPSLTSISLSPLEPRGTPVPTVRSSISNNNASTLNKMPVVTNERKKKVQLPEHLRCPE